MSATNPQQMLAMLNALVQPWNDAVADPATAQQQVLARLRQIYAQTDYGKQHRAARISTIEEYRRAFPVTTYESYKPLIQRVMAGEVNLLLNEPPIPTKNGNGSPKRWRQVTPATAASLTDHFWTTDELLGFHVPPRSKWKVW